MYKNITAADVLGTSSQALRRVFQDRQISMDSYGKLQRGKFDPYFPSKDILDRFREIARNLGDPDAFRVARPDVRSAQRDFRGLPLTERFNEGGRVGYASGGIRLRMETDVKNIVDLLRSVRNELKKLSLDGEFDIEMEDYVAGTEQPMAQATQIKQTPPVDPNLITQGTMGSTTGGQNILPTGLTATETALLSNEEKAMRLRQRGLA